MLTKKQNAFELIKILKKLGFTERKSNIEQRYVKRFLMT